MLMSRSTTSLLGFDRVVGGIETLDIGIRVQNFLQGGAG
jgi:hypothetical protein